MELPGNGRGAEPVNPYAPPQAAVRDVVVASVNTPFYAVGIPKFVVLSVCTLNLYLIYWAYRHWRAIARRGEDIWPVPRAIFFGLVSYGLFRRLNEAVIRFDLQAPRLPAVPLAIGVFVTGALTRLPDPWWLLTLAQFLLLIPAQEVANTIVRHVAPEADENTALTPVNWIFIVVGGVLLALALLGIFGVSDEA